MSLQSAAPLVAVGFCTNPWCSFPIHNLVYRSSPPPPVFSPSQSYVASIAHFSPAACFITGGKISPGHLETEVQQVCGYQPS